MDSAEILPEVHLAALPYALDDPTSCIIDSGTSHTILRNRNYFKGITPSHRHITTITGEQRIEEGHGPAVVILPKGTTIEIESAIFAPKATRNLLSFRDIRANGLHIQTGMQDSKEVIHLISRSPEGSIIKETLTAFPLGLYATETHTLHAEIEPQSITKKWHTRLGHPGTSMFQRILRDVKGIPSTVKPTTLTGECLPCSKGKMITRPSPSKLTMNIPTFLAELQADVCGPIDPPSGPFRFFLAMLCASSKWSIVSLLTTRNMVFPRILAHIQRLKAQYPDYPIKSLRVDNAGEFTSRTFDDFCTAAGIQTQYPVAHVHFQNGMAESLIKRIQQVARPLLMQSNLPPTAWGHAVLHAAALLNYRPSAFNSSSPYHLALGNPPSVAHLRTFGCQVMVPILGPKRTKMGPQRHAGIYIGFDSNSIIRYLEPTTADVFKARFADCHFYEESLPRLGPLAETKTKDLLWQIDTEFWNDPRTSQAETEVQRILHLTKILNQLPDSFADIANVTRSHVPAANTPARIPTTQGIAQDTAPRAKRGRPLGATDRTPRRRRPVKTPTTSTLETIGDETEEIAINYNVTGHIWDRLETEIDDNFAFQMSMDITDDLPDPKTLKAAQKQSDWPRWQKAIHSELDSLIARQVFGPITKTPPGEHLTGYKWTFIKKRNAKGETVRHKARLVAKGFTQIPGRDYDLTYSPVMDVTTYRYLINFAQRHQLVMHQMDIVTAYLYGYLDTEIYLEAPPELVERVHHHCQGEHPTEETQPLPEDAFTFTDPRVLTATSQQISPYKDRKGTEAYPSNDKYRVKVLRSIYGLKQSGRTWYKKFQAEMLAMGFTNEDIAPCLFIKKEGQEFIVVAIYVDDLNLFGTSKITKDTIQLLKDKFEMRDLGQTHFCLGLQFEHLQRGIFLHQSTYTKRVLKQFNMEHAKAVRSPMDLRSLEKEKDIFRKREENEPILDSSKPYLSAIGALMYLANQTRPDISFAVSLLARHSKEPTIRHWNGVKRILKYLSGTIDTGIHYPHGSDQELRGFADAGYLSDPGDAKSQTGYVFQIGNSAISWKSSKQTLTTTSSNHSEIIALYEASRECLWLRNVMNHILESTGMHTLDKPTIIYEDNRPCVQQIAAGYIKGDKTKHIAPKFFLTHELQGKKIDVQWIESENNCADILTKPLPPITHSKLTRQLGMRKLTNLLQEEEDIESS